jgi:hypothetical protein
LYTQQKYSEAKTVYEEMYNLVAEAYYVDHPMVLTAANYLINVLILTEEFEDAERYARISYECLTRSVDSECEEIANASESLANVTFELICRKGVEGGDIMEAEMLCRKALRIKEKIHGANQGMTVNTRVHLSNILSVRGIHDNERERLLQQCLAINIRVFGINGSDTAMITKGLENLHSGIATNLPPGDEKTEQLRISYSYHKEVLRINKVLASHSSTDRI